MKWRHDKPMPGDIIEKFAWLPVLCYDEVTVWLQKCYVAFFGPGCASRLGSHTFSTRQAAEKWLEDTAPFWKSPPDLRMPDPTPAPPPKSKWAQVEPTP